VARAARASIAVRNRAGSSRGRCIKDRIIAPISVVPFGRIAVTADMGAASAATLREVINVNLYGGLLCAREAVRSMATAKGVSNGDAIVALQHRVPSLPGASSEVRESFQRDPLRSRAAITSNHHRM